MTTLSMRPQSQRSTLGGLKKQDSTGAGDMTRWQVCRRVPTRAPCPSLTSQGQSLA